MKHRSHLPLLPCCIQPCRSHGNCRRYTRSSVRRAGGFTLLELLAVIGIIVTLAAIVAVAFNVVGNNAAARRTRVALETCLSLQGEYENSVALSTSLKTSMVAAGNLSASPDVDPTAKIAIKIRSVPKNRDAEDKMSSGTFETFNWTPSTPNWGVGTNYDTGDYVMDGAAFYLCTQPNSATTINEPTMAGGASYWSTSATPTAVPVIVPIDGWDKGIRFVGSSLTGLFTTDSTGAKVSRPNVTSPNGRPFWVSAGPDGDFTTHDDNVYSFEN